MANSHDARGRSVLQRRHNRPPLSRHRRLRSTAIFSILGALVLSLACAGLAVAGEIADPGHIAASLRSPVANPFCTVPTFAVLSLPGQARALLERDDKPLILIDHEVAASGGYARFLLAHECCHHGRGHLARLAEKQKTRELAWQEGTVPEASEAENAMTALGFSLSARRMELDADCCAATLLAERGDQAGLAAAIVAMEAFGARPTGPAYPPGLQRAHTIKGCARP